MLHYTQEVKKSFNTFFRKISGVDLLTELLLKETTTCRSMVRSGILISWSFSQLTLNRSAMTSFGKGVGQTVYEQPM